MGVSSSLLPPGLSATGVATDGIAIGGAISSFVRDSVGVGVALSRYCGSETEGVDTEDWRQGPARASGVPAMTVASKLAWKGKFGGFGDV